MRSRPPWPTGWPGSCAWGEEAPCLLVLDDLHAADEDSLAVLANLARRLPQLRCAMVAAARARPPDLSVALDALVERLGQAGTAVVWDLQPLGVEDTTRLAAHWLRASPDAALAARLWESSLGNPFYLGQAIRSLQEAFPAGPSSDAGSFVPTLASASPVRARLARLGDTAERTAMTSACSRRWPSTTCPWSPTWSVCPSTRPAMPSTCWSRPGSSTSGRVAASASPTRSWATPCVPSWGRPSGGDCTAASPDGSEAGVPPARR